MATLNADGHAATDLTQAGAYVENAAPGPGDSILYDSSIWIGEDGPTFDSLITVTNLTITDSAGSANWNSLVGSSNLTVTGTLSISYNGQPPFTISAPVAPSAANVKTGITINGVLGTYTGSDRWTDPGEAHVESGVAYKANSVTNNKTGTLTGGGGGGSSYRGMGLGL